MGSKHTVPYSSTFQYDADLSLYSTNVNPLHPDNCANLSDTDHDISANQRINEPSIKDFKLLITHIQASNPNIPLSMFVRLKNIATNLLKNDIKYQTLYADQPLFIETIGWNGIYDFLNLLGFQYNAKSNAFVCLNKLTKSTINDAIDALQAHITMTTYKRSICRNISEEDDEKQIILSDTQTDVGVIMKNNDDEEFIFNNIMDQDDEDVTTSESIDITGVYQLHNNEYGCIFHNDCICDNMQ